MLEEALVEFPGCALVVSHDRWFLDKVATGILAFEGDGRVDLLRGRLLGLARRARKRSASSRERTAPSRSRRAPKRESKPRGGAQAELQGEAGARRHRGGHHRRRGAVAELQATLDDPTIYKTRAAEVPALVAALDAARAEVERLYARWQELESLL